MDLKNDRYFQHFKGGLYKLLLMAKDSETLENVVVYQSIHEGFDIWTRSEKSFFSSANNNGEEVPRFRELTKEEFS
jgi:hypothetical protein